MNMIKQLAALSLGVAVALPAMGVVSASDRLEIVDVEGAKHYVMVSDIQTITYTHPETTVTTDRFTHVVLTLVGGKTIEMPIDECRELLYNHIDKTPYAITNLPGEHGGINMLYNFNDPDRDDCYSKELPYGWRGSWANGPVFFLAEPERGYTGRVHVVGDLTGKEYHTVNGFITTSIAENNYRFGINLECLEYTMPFEPVTMWLETVAESTYAGADFVGMYTGARLNLNGGAVLELPRIFSLDLRENGAYTLTCPDDPAVTVIDFYTFDEENRRFSYIASENDIEKSEFETRIRYGAEGRLFAGDRIMWVKVRDVVDNRAETNRYYVASRDIETPFVIAESIGGRRQLLEAGSDYLFIDEYGEEPFEANVEFRSGSSIKEPCVATITTVSATPRVFRYIFDGGEAEPQFITQGAEAGTFTNGADQIILDGFDTIIVGGQVYSYTINGSAVTVNINGEDVTYILNLQDRTYTTAETIGEWNGPKRYTNANVKYGSSTNADLEGGSMSVTVDLNYAGNADKQGYLVAKVYNKDARAIVEVYGDYIYNPAAKTLTLSKAWIGTSASAAAYAVLVFHLSDDLQTIWFDDEARDRIYATSRNGEYFYTGVINTANAE